MAAEHGKYRARGYSNALANPGRLLALSWPVHSLNACIALILTLELAACGPRYRKEALGSGVAMLKASRAAQPVPVAIDKAGDEYEVRYTIDLPRAVELQYQFECPGGEQKGVAGQTFEAYRRMRIAQLRREKEQQRKAIASVGQSIGGAVLGKTRAGAQVSAPVAAPQPQGQPGSQVEGQVEGQVEAEVDGEQVGAKVGEAVAGSVIDDDVQLPPGDVGAQVINRAFQFTADSPGACSMTVWSEREGQDIRGVTARFTVARVIDVKEEKRIKNQAQAEARARRDLRIGKAALEVRVALGQQMISRGADPELSARVEAKRRLELEQRRQAEIEAARLRAAKATAKKQERAAQREARRREREARREAERRERELRWRTQEQEARRLRMEAERVRKRRVRIALDARRLLLAWCVSLGADPELRARLEAEAAAARLAADAEEARRLARIEAQAEAEIRARDIRAARRRARLAAEAEARRRRVIAIREGSLSLRGSLMVFLETQGADPEYQERLIEARVRAKAERARARQAAREARAQRRQLALDTRGYLREFLRAQGALTVEERRPPPAPVEDRPPQPFENAIWVSGRYVSVQGTWQWRAGYWKRPPRSWSLPRLPAGISIEVSGPAIKVEGESQTPAPASEGEVRDHRGQQNDRP